MSRGRFALFVTLLAVAVAAISFAAGLRVLDDGNPDPPPSSGSVDATDTTLPPVAPSSTTTTTTSSTAPTPPSELETPAWVAVVASEGSRDVAVEAAAMVAAKGYPAGVLRSDDYPSLSRGIWVAYAGPYADSRAAEAAIAALDADGIVGAYVRCVGSKKECSSSSGHDD